MLLQAAKLIGAALANILRGSLNYKIPLLFALGFIFLFTVGGVARLDVIFYGITETLPFEFSNMAPSQNA